MAVRLTSSQSEYLSRSADLLPYNAAYTAVGFYQIVSDTNDYSHIFQTSNSTSNVDDLGIDADGTTLALYDGATTATGASLTVGAWVGVAIVRASATDLRMYYKASPTTAGVQTGSTITNDVSGRAAADAMQVGRWVGSNIEFANARWAGWKVYTAALTLAELENEWRSLTPKRTANLWGWYPAVHADIANAVKDYSGNGRDWTANNTPTVEDAPPISWGARQIIVVPSAVASGDIAGTIDLTITPVGALTGAGALAGAVALSLTPTGSLTGAGVLAGSIALALDIDGALTNGSAGSVTGAIELAIAATGALTGTGALDGAVPLDLDVAGALTGTGALAGAVPLSITPQGSLTGAGALSGSVGIALDIAGTLIDSPSSEIAGSVALSLDVTGALVGAGALVGSIDLGFGISGTFVQTASEFSGGLFFAFEREVERRRKERRKREEDEEEAKKLKDDIDREIAVLLHQQEADDAEAQELSRLKVMVAQFADKAAEEAMTERVRSALVRANVQQNVSAYLALERELTRVMEEEEFMILMVLAN